MKTSFVIALLIVPVIVFGYGALRDMYIECHTCPQIDIWVSLSIEAENAILEGDMDKYKAINAQRELLLSNI